MANTDKTDQPKNPHCANCGKELYPLMDQQQVNGRLLCGRCASRQRKAPKR